VENKVLERKKVRRLEPYPTPFIIHFVKRKAAHFITDKGLDSQKQTRQQFVAIS
jgi:hypothetical protein